MRGLSPADGGGDLVAVFDLDAKVVHAGGLAGLALSFVAPIGSWSGHSSDQSLR